MNGSIPDVRKDSLLRRICNPAQQELRISESAKSARTFQRPHASKQATHRNCFLGLQILMFHCVGLQIPRSNPIPRSISAACPPTRRGCFCCCHRCDGFAIRRNRSCGFPNPQKSARTFQRPRGACGQHIGIVFSDYKS